jgi:hypothetical protein
MKERFQIGFEVARERLEASALLLEEGFPADAASRSYYGVYEAARVLLASRDVRPATHEASRISSDTDSEMSPSSFKSFPASVRTGSDVTTNWIALSRHEWRTT